MVRTELTQQRASHYIMPPKPPIPWAFPIGGLFIVCLR